MQLQDTFGRRFNYLRLSITEMCNFRCNYCLPNGNDCDTPKGGLSLTEIKTLVSAFAAMGTTKIRITGGEPALRKDLTDIITLCKQTPGIEKVALTTNGFLLNRDIKKYTQAGLDAINVSADSLDTRMFAAITGKEKLEDILAGIDKAISAGMHSVKFNTVLLKQFNYKELGGFFDYLKHHAVTWRFIELMQTGDNTTFFADNHVPGNQLKSILINQGWQRIMRSKDAGPAQEFSHPDYQGNIGLIMPYSKDFCDSCNRLRVSSQGKLHLCLFAEQGLDIRHLLASEDVEQVCEAIIAHLQDKRATHYLSEGYTGATKQLAMLGG
ncbi:GTP 3',8-cyclase MoaA [Aliiglaciecola litoralis]|uniref:GTP 3',8-cyclase n=1 Tax=Aliiglaciecola litoralis TaxID=582857 RepID=A0ABP3X1D1_9ALTE